MLVCHCNILTRKDIEAAILALLDADPRQLIVPAVVYNRLGRRGCCCGCFPEVVETIIRVTEAFHARNEGAESAKASHLDRVRELRGKFAQGAGRRPAGHQAV